MSENDEIAVISTTRPETESVKTALPPSFWRGMMLVAVLLGVAWINYSRLPTYFESNTRITVAPMVGFLAPDFTLPSTDGATVTLSSLRGQPVVLNFWATWCPPCQAEMPALETFWQGYGPKGLILLGIDQGESRDTVEKFVSEEVDITFPLLVDKRADVGALYGVRALPTTIFIDADGRIQKITVGGPLNRASLMDGGQQIGLAVQP